MENKLDNKKTKNSLPTSYFEQKDRCPSCGSYCNIDIDLNEKDECNDCKAEKDECNDCKAE